MVFASKDQARDPRYRWALAWDQDAGCAWLSETESLGQLVERSLQTGFVVANFRRIDSIADLPPITSAQSFADALLTYCGLKEGYFLRLTEMKVIEHDNLESDQGPDHYPDQVSAMLLKIPWEQGSPRVEAPILDALNILSGRPRTKQDQFIYTNKRPAFILPI